MGQKGNRKKWQRSRRVQLSWHGFWYKLGASAVVSFGMFDTLVIPSSKVKVNNLVLIYFNVFRDVWFLGQPPRKKSRKRK